MLTNIGPGVNPLQFAIVRTPRSRQATLVYFSPTYLSHHLLAAAGWNTTDPVFYEMCDGVRPKGAIELSWLQANVLQQGVAQPQLPTIPPHQVRYIPAYVYAKLTKALAEKLASIRSAFEEAAVGSAVGIGVMAYGPETLPLQLALTDHQGQREYYTVDMTVHSRATLQPLVRNAQQSLVSRQIELFSNGGVEFQFAWVPLARPNQPRAPTKPRRFSMLLPLDPLRVVLAREKANTFNNGRLAALIP